MLRLELVMLNPDQQEQLYPPTVLIQVEFGPQIDGSDKHSSTSVMAELAVILASTYFPYWKSDLSLKHSPPTKHNTSI